MRPIELVISDVDGTLVTHAGVLSEANRREIRRVIERGVHFSIATGRPTREVRRFLHDLNLSLPVIGSNGAMVEDLTTGEVIHSLQLDTAVIAAVLEALARHEVDTVFMDTPEGWAYQVRNAAGTAPRWITSGEITGVTQQVAEWEAYLADTRTVLKIVVEGEEPELQRFEHALSAIPEIQVSMSMANNREVFVAHAGKAIAAQALAANLGIDAAHVLAIGDQRNDVELIRWAGVGVAMGNATPELKAVADWVTRSNEEDGVAYALAHFIP